MISKSLVFEVTNLWKRGKSILWSTNEAIEIWVSFRSKRSGRTYNPGKRRSPLRVIHLRMISLKLQGEEIERVVAKAVPKIAHRIKYRKSTVNSEVIDNLLTGNEPPAYEISLELNEIRGGHILLEGDGKCSVPVWIGGRVSLMITEQEKRILRAKRGLPIIINNEEE